MFGLGFFFRNRLLQWMKNAVKIKKFEKLSALELLEFFKTGKVRKLFSKWYQDQFYKRTASAGFTQKWWRPSRSWPQGPSKKRSDLAATASEIPPYSFSHQGKISLLILSCQEPSRAPFLISPRQTIRKWSVNQWSWKKNRQGEILSAGLSALKTTKA